MQKIMIKEIARLMGIAFITGLLLGWHSRYYQTEVPAWLLLFASFLIGIGYLYTRRKHIAQFIHKYDSDD